MAHSLADICKVLDGTSKDPRVLAERLDELRNSALGAGMSGIARKLAVEDDVILW